MKTFPLLAMLAWLALPHHVLAGGTGIPGDEPQASEWNFRVYLDDKEIGYHNFRLVDDSELQRLTTEADFRVRFLFFTAFRYEHVNEETWRGDCLQTIRSSTDANGDRFSVQGEVGPEGFDVEASGGNVQVDGCVKTFAYWNPEFLNEPRLMNSQTGEILDVELASVTDELLTVRGKQVPARRYRLQAKDLQLDIWYSADDRWLGLESTVGNGRKLRYELA